MKIKIGETVYLQRYEVAYLARNLNSFPMNVLQEILKDSEGDYFSMNGAFKDDFRFECMFDNAMVVDWLMKQDWLIDYDEYADMSPAELTAFAERYDEERYAEMAKFNAQDEGYRETHLNEACDKFSRIDHKAFSLKKFAAFRRGQAEFVFPGGCRTRSASNIKKGLTFLPSRVIMKDKLAKKSQPVC